MKIPFEMQHWNDNSQRSCSAAALRMVCASFGLANTQDEIWEAISLPAPSGGRYSRTYRIVSHALELGLCAVAFQDRDPVNATKRLLSLGLRVIMNHRVTDESASGHYTVAVAANNAGITFHDPAKGPNQFITNSDLVSLWEKRGESCEIVGRILIALSANSEPPQTCSECGVLVYERGKCQNCKSFFPLQPISALRCITANCAQRTWELLVCPYCV